MYAEKHSSKLRQHKVQELCHNMHPSMKPFSPKSDSI